MCNLNQNSQGYGPGKGKENGSLGYSNAFWNDAKNNVNNKVVSRLKPVFTEKIDTSIVGNNKGSYGDSDKPSLYDKLNGLVSSSLSVVKKKVFGYDTRIPPYEMENWEKEHDEHNSLIRGTLDVINGYSATKPIASAFERYMDFKEIREAAIPIKSLSHTRAALETGLGIDLVNSRNLSSSADRYANKYEKLFDAKDKDYRKNNYINTGRNAIRHTIWQGVLSSKYGPKVARDIGDSHETRPYMDTSVAVFDNEADADMPVDLLNNKIGREIGSKYPGKGSKYIALKVLEEFLSNGLYTYKKEGDGRWYIKRNSLPYEVYKDMYAAYCRMDDYGF